MSIETVRQKYATWIAGLFVILITADLAIIGWKKIQSPVISESGPKGQWVCRFDPNVASVEELECLPDWNHKIAEEIVAYREEYLRRYPGKTAYRTREDLARVKGVSEKKISQAEKFLNFPDEISSRKNEVRP
jgi:hypothetical protein